MNSATRIEDGQIEAILQIERLNSVAEALFDIVSRLQTEADNEPDSTLEMRLHLLRLEAWRLAKDYSSQASLKIALEESK